MITSKVRVQAPGNDTSLDSLLLYIQTILLILVCWGDVCGCDFLAHVEVKGQLRGAGSLCPPFYGFRAWTQVTRLIQ